MRARLGFRVLAAAGCLLLGVAGCSLFDGEDDPEAGVCDDVFNGFADEYYPGVTSAQCEAAPRGEWIDGRCYCHGAE